MGLSAIIIDDVPQAIENLREDLQAYCPEVKVMGTADGVVSGAKLLKKLQPDILFLDIQLQDGSGFDLLEILGDLPFKLIFTTASDEFAIRAFRFAAIDYLLKPIDPEQLQQAVNRVGVQLKEQPEQLDLLSQTINESSLPKKLALHTQEKIHIVTIRDIVRCESSGNYTNFYFREGRALLVTKTLKEFDKMLSVYGFLRTHQSRLVNMSMVKAFVKTEGGYLQMTDGARVPVSVRKRAQVIEQLEQL